MEDITFIHGSIILEDAVLEDGAVAVRQGVIFWVGPTADCKDTSDKTVDLGGFYLSPGFIDLHVHGGGGIDCTVGDPEALKTICRTHEAFGTTSMCLAVISSPIEVTKKALNAIYRLATSGTGGCRLLGAYLEGPFINPSRAGAHHPDYLLYPDLDIMKSLAVSAGGWLRIVALAPELPDADQIIQWTAKEMGLVAAIAHTGATYEQARNAIQSGCILATHLYNGMKPFHHRDPNAAGAVLTEDGIFAELVVDEHHLHPAAVKIAYQLIGMDRLVLVTDATSVVGSGDGKGKLGDQPIHILDGSARLDSNENMLAGSALTMIDAVRGMIDMLKIPPYIAVHCASLNPARVLKIDDRLGSIKVGKHADLLVLDRTDMRVLYSYVSGRRIFKTPY